MYEQHFGFSRPLICDGIAQDEDVFKTPAISELASGLEMALTRRDSVAVLSGMSGTGKTTIASDALKNIDTQLAFSSIGHAPLSQSELLEQLLTDFGFETYKKSRVERLQLWRQFLSEMAATNTRVSLLIESAEDWPDDVLHSLHNLTAADADLSPGANIVFTTSQPTESLLTSAELIGLNQRVRLRRRIQPLTAEEVQDYLDFKCRQAGTFAGQIFAADLAPSLHRLSGGIIRVINNLLESVLIAAAAGRHVVVTSETLENVAVQQFGMSLIGPDSVEELLQDAAEETIGYAPDTDEIPVLTDVIEVDDDYEIAETAAGITA